MLRSVVPEQAPARQPTTQPLEIDPDQSEVANAGDHRICGGSKQSL
jgi:hypothetical protein